ncbi:Gfo/Idh/MocA family oxidoreductase [Leucobacter tenebrionis]|nr:Gfo/Idh/MocA family oxidoreductase [Leucobacter tenebrionis]
MGCGNIADNHVRAYESFDAVEVVAVCDVDLARAEAFASERGIERAVDSVQKLVDLGVDAVSVCTPHPTHEQVVTEAVRRGVHVLCEKPISVDAGAARRMIATAEENDVLLGVVYQRRFWPAAQRIRTAIDSGALGTPMLGRCDALLHRGDDYYRSAPWRGTWAADGGGVLMTQAVHYLDLLQWYMGAPVEVYARAGNFTHQASIEVEDTVSAVVTFESGAIATINATVSAAPSLGASIAVTGSSGATVEIAEYPEGSDATVEVWTVPGEEEAGSMLVTAGFQPSKTVNEVNASLEGFHRLQLQDFVEAIREGREPTVTGKDALHSLAMIEAVYESARTGVPVKLGERAEPAIFAHLDRQPVAANVIE